MWPTAWLSSNHADVLTFSMILMLIYIQVRVLDLSGDSVYRHVESHDLTSHQHFLSIVAAPSRSKHVPHRPNTLPIAREISGQPRGAPGAMLWAAEG